MTDSNDVKVGDEIRIRGNANVHRALRGKVAEVTAVKGWGMQAAVYVDVGTAFVRVAHGEYDKGSGRDRDEN